MRVLVDADACPVKEIIIKLAKRFSLEVIMFIDTSHILNDGYSTIITVDKASDSVDIALINQTQKGDVVVTQDYGLASLILGKGANCIHQNGFIYSDENIDKLLFERHIGKKIRQNGGRTKGPRKRTNDDNLKFEANFKNLLEKLINEN